MPDEVINRAEDGRRANSTLGKPRERLVGDYSLCLDWTEADRDNVSVAASGYDPRPMTVSVICCNDIQEVFAIPLQLAGTDTRQFPQFVQVRWFGLHHFH